MTEPFKIEPRVAALLKSGEAKKVAAAKIRKRIDTLVKQLRKKYPAHDDSICRLLEGASSTIRNEKEATKREARGARIKEKG